MAHGKRMRSVRRRGRTVALVAMLGVAVGGFAPHPADAGGVHLVQTCRDQEVGLLAYDQIFHVCYYTAQCDSDGCLPVDPQLLFKSAARTQTP